MLTSDDDARLMLVAVCEGHVDIELLGRIFCQCDLDAIFGNECFATVYIFRGAVAQYFKALACIARQCAYGYGYGESHHACAGNAYAHSVLQNVGTQSGADVCGGGVEFLCCASSS